MKLLSAITTNIISSILYDSPSAIINWIKRNKSINKRFELAFKKAVCEFYADPDICGIESILKENQYIEHLKSKLISPANFSESVPYKQLASLFEQKVMKDPYLVFWVWWNNIKYTKEKIEQIYGSIIDISNKSDQLIEYEKENSSKLDDIRKMLCKSIDNRPVKILFPFIEQAIEKLDFDNAYKYLDKLRESLIIQYPIDKGLLSKVDYQRGICARFQSNKEYANILSTAYQEMLDSDSYDEDIYAGKILSLIKQNDKDGAIAFAKVLGFKSPQNIWTLIPEVYYSNEVSDRIIHIEQERKNLVLANLYLLGKEFDVSSYYDLNSFTIDIPDNITIDNLPLWILYLNIYIAKYYNIDGYDLTGTREATTTVRQLFEITSKYLELTANTSISHLFPDVRYINSYMGFVIDKNIKWLESFEKCKCSQNSQSNYNLFHAVILNILGRYDDALKALEDGKVHYDTNIAEVMRCIIAIHSKSKAAAIQAYKNLSENGITLQDYESYYILVPLVNWGLSLGEYIDKIPFSNPITKELFQEVNKCVSTKSSDLSWFEKHIDIYQGSDIIRIIAIAYSYCGHTKKGIDLLKQLITNDATPLAYQTLFELYESNADYADEEYGYLKKLRDESKASPEMLNKAYHFATQCSDYQDALVTITKLRNLFPDNKRVYLCYLQTQVQLNNSQVITVELENIRHTEFEEEAIPALFDLLVSVNQCRFALEILYKAVIKYDTRLLNNKLLIASFVVPVVSNIIQTEGNVVESESYIKIKSDIGEEKFIDLSDGTTNKEYLNCHLNETIKLVENGKTRFVTVVEIRNKYFKLVHELMSVVSTQKPKECALKMFSSEDIFKDGNPLENLAKMAGVSEDDKKQRSKNLDDYKQGTTSIVTLLNGYFCLSECYNKLFGDFQIYTYPYQFYEQFFYYDINLNEYTFVLDVTSLIMFYELHRTLGIKLPFTKKPIVPLGLRTYIEESIVKESSSLPSPIDSDVAEEFEINIGHNPFATKLRSILDWIDFNCIVEIADKKLALGSSLHPNHFFNIEVESCILLMKDMNRILISEDWGLLKMLNHRIKFISVESIFWAFDSSEKNKVSHFLYDHHYVGCQIDSAYLYKQFVNKNNGVNNSFDDCLLTIERYKISVEEIIEAADIILTKNYYNSSSIDAVTSILKALFIDMDMTFVNHLLDCLTQAYGNQSVLYKCAIDAIMSQNNNKNTR